MPDFGGTSEFLYLIISIAYYYRDIFFDGSEPSILTTQLNVLTKISVVVGHTYLLTKIPVMVQVASKVVSLV
jgi:hypothetical protein